MQAMNIRNYFKQRGFEIEDFQNFQAEIVRLSIEDFNKKHKEQAAIQEAKNRNQKGIESHKERVRRVKEQRQQAANSIKPDLSLKKYDGVFKCPECNAPLYKEGVCGACADGKAGKKVRLICSNFPECQFNEAI